MAQFDSLKQHGYWLADFEMKLSDEVSEYLLLNKISKKDLAKKLSISKKKLNKILAGKFKGSLELYIKILILIDKIPCINFLSIEEYKNNHNTNTIYYG